MTTKEFSDQFDVLYNNTTSNQAPGLNEYEKSVFLTKAQDELVKNYFLPQSNPKQAGFDDNQKRQIDFSMLMAVDEGDPVNETASIDPRAFVFSLPDDILYIINESVQFYTGETTLVGIRQVIPLDYGEYMRLMSKPFKEPVKYQAWRLLIGTKSGTNTTYPKVELIITSSDRAAYITGDEGDGMKYVVRYVKRPVPIVLTNLANTFGENVSIHGIDSQTECELDPAIHEEILQRAVELAKIAWEGDTKTTIEVGTRSE